jgi:hypothetical protein
VRSSKKKNERLTSDQAPSGEKFQKKTNAATGGGV